MPIAPKVSVTTTPNIDGWEIDAYLGPVVAHSVAGTGFFSDWAAGLSDVFGGRSTSYQKQLRSLSDEAILAMKQKAAALKANWVVGLTVDMDEISGQGKQMFMITAMGTAVRARLVREAAVEVQQTPLGEGKISAELVAASHQRRQVLESIEQRTFQFNDTTWGVLIDQRLASALPLIVQTLAQMRATSHSRLDWFRERAITFIERLDPTEASTAVHALVGEGNGISQAAIELIAQTYLRDLGALRQMLETSEPACRRRQIQLLNAQQRLYAVEDIEHLRAIADFCTEAYVPRIATLIPGKSGIFGKGEKLRCECRTDRSVEEPYCLDCRRDVFGFTKDEVTLDSARTYCLDLATSLEQAFADATGVGALI